MQKTPKKKKQKKQKKKTSFTIYQLNVKLLYQTLKEIEMRNNQQQVFLKEWNQFQQIVFNGYCIVVENKSTLKQKESQFYMSKSK